MWSGLQVGRLEKYGFMKSVVHIPAGIAILVKYRSTAGKKTASVTKKESPLVLMKSLIGSLCPIFESSISFPANDKSDNFSAFF